ncbi:D(4) dopamine receptor isoform X1 [Strix uralensis]|uniref:D(4) dopamine receptor isoform X1 n=1 Tax=Strix uralensis TaxID=36305 RepID=UPI003DA2D16F
MRWAAGAAPRRHGERQHRGRSLQRHRAAAAAAAGGRPQHRRPGAGHRPHPVHRGRQRAGLPQRLHGTGAEDHHQLLHRQPGRRRPAARPPRPPPLRLLRVPGRRVVPQHGAVRCPDDHGRDAMHSLHLQPLCYQRGSVSVFLLLLMPEWGALCPGTKLLPHTPSQGSSSLLRRVLSPTVSSPSLWCPLSAPGGGPSQSCPFGCSSEGWAGCSPDLGYVSKLKGGKTVASSSGTTRLLPVVTPPCTGRFIAVSIPLNYNRRQIDLRQLILISTTWIFAFAVASPVIFGLNNVPNRDPSLCQLEDDNYIVYSSICSFFIPCPVMLVLYCAMFHGLKRWEEARKAKLRGSIYGANRKLYRPSTFLEREPTGLEPEGCNPYTHPEHPGDCGVNNGIQTVSYPHLQYHHTGHSRKRAKINGRERKAMRVLPVVVGAFLFCWTPFFVVHITRALCKSCTIPTQVTSTVTWLGYVNSALNPIIYTVFNAEFRNFFRKVLHLFC